MAGALRFLGCGVRRFQRQATPAEPGPKAGTQLCTTTTVPSRRQFLAGLGAATGGCVPYFFTSRQARAASKNARPRLAAIGLGGQGVGIATGALAHADLVACCDVDRRRAEKFAATAAARQGQPPAVYTDSAACWTARMSTW